MWISVWLVCATCAHGVLYVCVCREVTSLANIACKARKHRHQQYTKHTDRGCHRETQWRWVRRAGGRRKWWRARRVNAEKEHTLLLYEMQLQFSVMVQCTSNKFWLLNEGNAMGFYTPLYLCVVFTQKEVGQRSFTFSLNWREKSY